jgi:hypothetical protein
MEDFKSNPKMQCFKEGGSVKYESRKEHKEEMKADINQDKKIVKKAIAMHDKQEHKGEKTDLSKLKKGGRAKKDCGTVRKYKTGGSVENAYGAKKTDKDIKDIASSKRQKPKMLCGGGKSYADGGGVFDAIKSGATKLKENILGTDEQNRIAQEQMDKQATEGSKLAKFLGGKKAVPMPSAPAGAKTVPMPENDKSESNSFTKGLKPLRKGGKVC